MYRIITGKLLRKYLNKFNFSWGPALSMVFVVALVTLPLALTGCQNDMEQFENLLPSSEFSVLSVPDVDMGLYIYAKQRYPTAIPADIINMKHDITVESLAVWGMQGERNMVAGMGLTFEDAVTATDVYDSVKYDSTLWTLLRGSNLYVVKGDDPVAESLKTAITDNKFVRYDNSKLEEAANMLPKSVRAKLIAIALAEPSPQLMKFIGENIKEVNLDQVNHIIRAANLELFIAGLYSPNGINIAKAMEISRGGENLADLNMGLLIALKSGFPGIIIEPRMKSILVEQGLAEGKSGEYTVYKGYWSTPGINKIPVYARVEQNYLFLAISGQEEYGETLITSIYK